MSNRQLPAKLSWKDRLYGGYVSSGQSFADARPGSSKDPEHIFSGRRAHIQNIIGHLPADRASIILDLGCGHGAFVYFLEKAGYTKAFGVDISAEQIEFAHSLGIAHAKCGNLVDELQGSASDSIDAILLMDILEHLENEELFEILDEVSRVLRRGGVCLAHVPNAEGIYGSRVRYSDLTHERAFTPKSAEQLFQTVGLREVNCFEDRPEIHGMRSLVRRILWTVGTIPHRLLLTVETGTTKFVLSQNMLISARKH
jgi:SAM-dependent methyltransferase